MKVILKGSPSVSWFLDGQQVCGGVPRELSPKQLKEAKSSNLIEDDIVENVAEVKSKKVYTEKEFFAWNKDRQVKELNKLGIKPASKEADRVKQLLEAQDD